MEPRVVSVAELLKLNTLLFRNCLVDFTEAQSRMRPTPRTNHAAYVAAHVTDARYLLLRVLGAEQPNPIGAYLAKAKTLDDVERWPTLAETRAAWDQAAHALRERLGAITSAELDGTMRPKFFRDDQTCLYGLTFLTQHEAYHVGQLSLLRTFVGLPAMKYP
jgi:uncharacterized damage-inducible protein DinB